MAETQPPKPVAPSLSQVTKLAPAVAPSLSRITPAAPKSPGLKVVAPPKESMWGKLKKDIGLDIVLNPVGAQIFRTGGNAIAKKSTGRVQTEVRATQALVEHMPTGTLQFFGGLGIDVGETALSATLNALTFGHGGYHAPNIWNTTTGHAIKSFANTAQVWKRIPQYKKAWDNGEAIVPLLVEDAGNLTIALGGLKGISKGIASTAELSASESAAAAAEAEAAIASHIETGTPIDMATYDAYANKAAEASNRAQVFANKASRFNKITENIAKAQHYVEMPMAAPIKPWTIGGKMLGSAIREGIYVEGIIGWGRKAAEGYAAEIDKLVQENPDIDINNPDLQRLQKKLSNASRIAMSPQIRAFIRQAVRNTNHDRSTIEKALLDIQQNPEFRDEINPATGEKWGPLSDAEQQAVISIVNGRGQLIKWFADHIPDMTPEEASVLGRYDASPEYHLSPEGARLAYEILTPDSAQITPEHYQRLSGALESLSRASNESLQSAVNGYGRKNRLSPQYAIPLPFAERLARNVMKFGSKELKSFWKKMVEEGILEKDINDIERQEFLMAVVQQLPDEVALDASMYPAQMRENIEFYKRWIRSYNRMIGGEAIGEPIPPYDGSPRNPDEFTMTTKGGKLGAVENLISTTKAKIEKLANKALEIHDKIAIKEVEHQKLAEKIKKYDIVDDFISGKSIKSIAKRNYMSVAEVTEIINKNAAGKLFVTLTKIQENIDALTKEIGVKRASLAPDQFDAELAAMEETLSRYTEEAATAKRKVDAARGFNEMAKLSDNAEVDRIANEIFDLEDQVFDVETDLENAGGDPLALWKEGNPTDDQLSVITASMGQSSLKSINSLIDDRLMNLDGVDKDILQRTKQVLESAWAKAENQYLDAAHPQLAEAAHKRLIQVSTYLNAVVEKINEVIANPGDVNIDQAVAQIIYDISTNKTDQAILSGTAPIDMPIRAGTPGATPPQRPGRFVTDSEGWPVHNYRQEPNFNIFGGGYKGVLSTAPNEVAKLQVILDAFRDPSGIINPDFYSQIGDVGRMAEAVSQLVRWVEEVRSTRGEKKVFDKASAKAAAAIILNTPDYFSPEWHQQIIKNFADDTDPTRIINKWHDIVDEILPELINNIDQIETDYKLYNGKLTQVDWKLLKKAEVRTYPTGEKTVTIRFEEAKGKHLVLKPSLVFDHSTPVEVVIDNLDTLIYAVEEDNGTIIRYVEIGGVDRWARGHSVEIRGLSLEGIKSKQAVLDALNKVRSEILKLKPLDRANQFKFRLKEDPIPGVMQKPPFPAYVDMPFNVDALLSTMKKVVENEFKQMDQVGPLMKDAVQNDLDILSTIAQELQSSKEKGYIDVTHFDKATLDYFITYLKDFQVSNIAMPGMREYYDFLNFQHRYKVVITPEAREVMAPDIPVANKPAFVKIPVNLDSWIGVVELKRKNAIEWYDEVKDRPGNYDKLQLDNALELTDKLLERLNVAKKTGYVDVIGLNGDELQNLLSVLRQISGPDTRYSEYHDFLEFQHKNRILITPETSQAEIAAGKPQLQPVTRKTVNGKQVDYVVIPCGAEKLTTSAKAADMYIGSMFKDALTTARGIVSDENIFILSAKYGLVRLDQVIEPYDVKLGQPGTISKESLAGQIGEIIPAGTNVLSLLPADYHGRFIAGAGELNVDRAFEGTKGIGQQKGRLKAIREEAATQGNLTPVQIVEEQLHPGAVELPAEFEGIAKQAAEDESILADMRSEYEDRQMLESDIRAIENPTEEQLIQFRDEQARASLENLKTMNGHAETVLGAKWDKATDKVTWHLTPKKGQPEWEWWYKLGAKERQSIARDFFTSDKNVSGAAKGPRIVRTATSIDNYAEQANMQIDEFADALLEQIDYIRKARKEAKEATSIDPETLRQKFIDDNGQQLYSYLDQMGSTTAQEYAQMITRAEYLRGEPASIEYPGLRPLPDNPELVQYERNLTDPNVRRAAYDVDVVDSMARDYANKMRKAERASDRLKAFQDFIDASKKFDETIAAMREKQKTHERARLRLSKNAEIQRKQRERLSKIGKETKKLRKIVTSAETNPLLPNLMQLKGSMPLEIAMSGDYPSQMYSVNIPENGDVASYEQPMVGPMYLPTGRSEPTVPGLKYEVTREGLDGFKKASSEHYRDGDRHTIFSLRLVAKRMGADIARFTRNERFQALISQFGQTVHETIGEEKAQQLFQQAHDIASNLPVGEQMAIAAASGAEIGEYVDGISAYSTGNVNPKAVFELARRQLYGQLIAREMSFKGLSPIDPYQAIGAPVAYRNITHETTFVPEYFRQHVARIEAVQNATDFNAVVKAMHKVTGKFKTGALVLSTTWQLGDLISNMIIAHMTGVKVPEMIKRMKEIKTAEYGEGIRSLIDPTAEMPTPSPVGRLAQESPVQDISMAQEERRVLQGMPALKPKEPLLTRLGRAVGKDVAYPEVLQGRSIPKVSFKINETINRIQRHAYFLEMLDRRLAEVGKDLDTVVADGSWRSDPATRQLVFDAADTANKWLGDFSDLTMAERKYVTAVVPFWAWIKHIHKVFYALGVEHPQSLAWYIYLGTLGYNPNEDPMGLRYGGTSLFGGTVSTNFLNPLGDVVKGPIGALLTEQDLGPALNIQGPATRLLGGMLGFDATKGKFLTRPSGTGNYSASGQERLTPLIMPNRWGELAGFTAQQFPLVQRIQNILPGSNIPGTNIALGPVQRYQTGEARINPVTGKRIEKWGGELASIGRLFSIPGIPGQTDQQVADIQRAAVMRLRTIQALKYRRAHQPKP